MPFITVMQSPRHQQITLDQILSGEVEIIQQSQNYISGTVTRYVKQLSPHLIEKANVADLVFALEKFVSDHNNLYEKDRHTLYRTFYIPKRSGGLRQIDAPNDELMDALRELKTMFESNFGALYHTSAFAYIKNRSTIDSVKRHQANKSRWFLKTDFSNFFGSTTKEFLMKMLSEIYPFSEIILDEEGLRSLGKAIDLCLLDGGLPQGTPISPMLTNLMMIPIDYVLTKELRKEGFVYTRYADDILISHEYNFDPKEKCEFINKTLERFDAPFQIKDSKTRYASSSGSNWNLGVMLNKDNEITIGYRKKKVFKAMCSNYITSKSNNAGWERHDIQVFGGLISYYMMIEPDYIKYIIDHYNKKYNVDIMGMIHDDLR